MGWLRDPVILAQIGAELCALFDASAPTVVLRPSASGYSLGALAALSAGAGFVGVEKTHRRLSDSDPWLTAVTPPDYRDRNLDMSIRARLITPTDRVLVVDDWADTGGQLTAMESLVRQAGAELIGAAVVVDGMSDRALRRTLGLRSILNVRELVD